VLQQQVQQQAQWMPQLVPQARQQPSQQTNEHGGSSEQGAEQQPAGLRSTRPRGRPPKKLRFNFMTPANGVPHQQQTSSIPDGPLDQHDGASRRSTRERTQRQIYDPSTGNSVNPCG